MTPEPNKRDEVFTDATDSPIFVYEGPGDSTVRPRRPNNPPFWPKGMPLPKENQQPPSNGAQS